MDVFYLFYLLIIKVKKEQFDLLKNLDLKILEYYVVNLVKKTLVELFLVMMKNSLDFAVDLLIVCSFVLLLLDKVVDLAVVVFLMLLFYFLNN